MTKRLLACALLFLMAALPIGAARGAAGQDPAAFINDLGNQALQVSGPSVPLDQRIARFNELFRSDFDIDRLGQFVLGPYARAATPEQRRQFLNAFQNSIVSAYAKRFGEYAGEPFRVTGVRQGGNVFIVSSEIVRRSGGPVTIDWSLESEAGRLKITDVAIDGLSMRLQERKLFGSLMHQSGERFDIALIAFARAGGSPPQYGSSQPH